MYAAVHVECLLQPKSVSTSIPSTTASLPAAVTWRACAGVVTMRYQPCPGPPYCASTNASRSWAARSCRSTAGMSAHPYEAMWLPALQSTSLLTASITIKRRPPSYARRSQSEKTAWLVTLS